jgi:hypothetical protein
MLRLTRVDTKSRHISRWAYVILVAIFVIVPLLLIVLPCIYLTPSDGGGFVRDDLTFLYTIAHAYRQATGAFPPAQSDYGLSGFLSAIAAHTDNVDSPDPVKRAIDCDISLWKRIRDGVLDVNSGGLLSDNGAIIHYKIIGEDCHIEAEFWVTR